MSNRIKLNLKDGKPVVLSDRQSTSPEIDYSENNPGYKGMKGLMSKDKQKQMDLLTERKRVLLASEKDSETNGVYPRGIELAKKYPKEEGKILFYDGTPQWIYSKRYGRYIPVNKDFRYAHDRYPAKLEAESEIQDNPEFHFDDLAKDRHALPNEN